MQGLEKRDWKQSKVSEEIHCRWWELVLLVGMTQKPSKPQASGRLSIPKTEKTRKVRHNVKTMIIVFFDIRGIAHWEFVRSSHIKVLLTSTFILRFKTSAIGCVQESLRTLAIRWLVPSSWQCPCSCSLTSKPLFSISIVSYCSLPSLLGRPLSNFFLFPRMKKNLKGKCFDDVKAVKTAS